MVVYKIVTFPGFLPSFGGSLKIFTDISIPERLKEGRSPFRESKLFNELTSVHTQLEVSNDNLYRAHDFAKS